MNENPKSNAVWEDKIDVVLEFTRIQALDKIDGEPMEFVWKIFPAFLSMREDCHQEDGHSSDLDQKRNGILLMVADHKENGTQLQSK